MKIIKLVENIYKDLEATNKKFSAAITNEARGSELFKKICDKYEVICNNTQTNAAKGRMAELLKAYYLEAWLGKLQAEENYLSENPENENILLENDKKLEGITKSLEELLIEANKFYPSIISKKSKSKFYSNFLSDCKETYNSINKYSNSWEKISNRTKANYYYNFSEDLIEKSKESHSDEETFLHRCSVYLKFCISFYDEADDQVSKEETEKKLEEVNSRIEQLKTARIRKRKLLSISSIDEDKAFKKKIGEKTNEPPLFTESNGSNTKEKETKEALTAVNLLNPYPEPKSTDDKETAHCSYRKPDERSTVSNHPSLSTCWAGIFSSVNSNSGSFDPTNRNSTSDEHDKRRLTPKMRHKAGRDKDELHLQIDPGIKMLEVAATAINLPNSTPELKNTGDETAHCDYRKEQPSVSNPPSLSTFRSGTFFHANLNSNSSNPTNEERTSECGKSHLLPKMRHKARFR
ncbi:hypothetical protein AYM02_07145 [Coxiella burnetii]|uniref:Dot/Icm T4SS effector CoxCC4 n=2 Tax=Coxiella burnetii TaxID=777 RepID=UPI0002F2DA6F|nr:Dot/Icm T4SS effector CoxCC4 [Coxiella burnetii]AML49100.1 hypothetical protein AUR58_07880 [Coxiella burnetii]AML55037.1 hypothetical protein AYM38_07045 [Coxiella burnetii]ATN69015.1 hypothetical protein AYM00_07445 [Coxiella burnetii]ATN70933.1 hypothetical protein AYM02_07145 [Coxiella burnetii]AZV75714.1 hypothetical protein D6219_07930 [Coxiella burnetii]